VADLHRLEVGGVATEGGAVLEDGAGEAVLDAVLEVVDGVAFVVDVAL
jgi:hypothetical protein